jgi:hypothetical protein
LPLSILLVLISALSFLFQAPTRQSPVQGDGSHPAEGNQTTSSSEKPPQDVDLIQTFTILSTPVRGKERSLIQNATVDLGYPPETCLDVPKGRELDFREIRADYDRNKSVPPRAIHVLQIPRPYDLVDSDLAREVTKSARLDESPLIRQRYPNAHYLISLSEVYFNHNRTVALAAINSWCGGLCGMLRWQFFEKNSNGGWGTRRWADTCSVFF